MAERKAVVTFEGNPLTLVGNQVKVGDTAPDVEVLANDLSPVKLSGFRGKVCVICSVPSLDTPVCDTQTRKFNEQAASLGDDVDHGCIGAAKRSLSALAFDVIVSFAKK